MKLAIANTGEVFVLVEFRLAAAVGNAPTPPVSETGVQTSTLSGKMVARAGNSPASAACKTAALILS